MSEKKPSIALCIYCSQRIVGDENDRWSTPPADQGSGESCPLHADGHVPDWTDDGQPVAPIIHKPLWYGRGS